MASDFSRTSYVLDETLMTESLFRKKKLCINKSTSGHFVKTFVVTVRR